MDDDDDDDMFHKFDPGLYRMSVLYYAQSTVQHADLCNNPLPQNVKAVNVGVITNRNNNNS